MTSAKPVPLATCRQTEEERSSQREAIPGIVAQLVASCAQGYFEHISPEPIPGREAVISLIHRAQRLLFPGYFLAARLDQVNLTYALGQEAVAFFEELSRQITLALRHDCLRYGLPCSHCQERGQEEAVRLLQQLPRLRAVLAADVQAAYDGDPAAKSYDEIISSYPGLFAVIIYRLAHELWKQQIPLLPRIMTEYAHSQTGIDIHPGAQIGESFFIDHGTGVVIGETTIIGRRVRLYQGVTLGALSLPPEQVDALRNQKRHPTVEDEVIIYAGATILGGKTVIGARSVIGGNVWLTTSVPPDTKVFLKKPELVYLSGRKKSGQSPAGD
ncbi:MAG: serine O-acetyltransferase EpsC [Desulfobacca sp.]|uniref:serine O-acetyltransferase EpsC n=1 Tax=Desulfobacca sp. TaxID=2067990 RepID=UPI00404A5832